LTALASQPYIRATLATACHPHLDLDAALFLGIGPDDNRADQRPDKVRSVLRVHLDVAP
jgi:hypothetical protein